jgi:hypothetical protein
MERDIEIDDLSPQQLDLMNLQLKLLKRSFKFTSFCVDNSQREETEQDLKDIMASKTRDVEMKTSQNMGLSGMGDSLDVFQSSVIYSNPKGLLTPQNRKKAKTTFDVNPQINPDDFFLRTPDDPTKKYWSSDNEDDLLEPNSGLISDKEDQCHDLSFVAMTSSIQRKNR